VESFISLPIEKQNGIIDATLLCFGTNGYKKTSVKDIAVAAGISKAAVFYYFGTKKALYFYLIDHCRDLMGQFKQRFDPRITDFFDRIRMAANIEISAIQRHPSIFVFLNSVYFESDEEVAADIQSMLSKGERFRYELALEGIDAFKFKEGIDARLILNILIRMTEGFISVPPGKTGGDFKAFCMEFDRCLELFRRYFYKEEYLDTIEER